MYWTCIKAEELYLNDLCYSLHRLIYIVAPYQWDREPKYRPEYGKLQISQSIDKLSTFTWYQRWMFCIINISYSDSIRDYGEGGSNHYTTRLNQCTQYDEIRVLTKFTGGRVPRPL